MKFLNVDNIFQNFLQLERCWTEKEFKSKFILK